MQNVESVDTYAHLSSENRPGLGGKEGCIKILTHPFDSKRGNRNI